MFVIVFEVDQRRYQTVRWPLALQEKSAGQASVGFVLVQPVLGIAIWFSLADWVGVGWWA
jgi:hypothetical protein